MSALFDFKAFLTVVLLTICACTFVKARFPKLLNERTGYNARASLLLVLSNQLTSAQRVHGVQVSRPFLESSEDRCALLRSRPTLLHVLWCCTKKIMQAVCRGAPEPLGRHGVHHYGLRTAPELSPLALFSTCTGKVHRRTTACTVLQLSTEHCSLYVEDGSNI